MTEICPGACWGRTGSGGLGNGVIVAPWAWTPSDSPRRQARSPESMLEPRPPRKPTFPRASAAESGLGWNLSRTFVFEGAFPFGRKSSVSGVPGPPRTPGRQGESRRGRSRASVASSGGRPISQHPGDFTDFQVGQCRGNERSCKRAGCAPTEDKSGDLRSTDAQRAWGTCRKSWRGVEPTVNSAPRVPTVRGVSVVDGASESAHAV